MYAESKALKSFLKQSFQKETWRRGRVKGSARGWEQMAIHWAVAEDLEEQVYFVFTNLGMFTQPFPNTEVSHAATDKILSTTI